MAKSSQDKKVVIIGAGMSGMLMAIRLKQVGISNIEILEKASEPGGTWRDNTYPGLACDVPGFLYTYSFEPNTQFANRYATGPEIRQYFLNIFSKYQLEKCVSYRQEVDSARYENGCWQLITKSGRTLTADIVISAVGVLHQPNYPDIAGISAFKGSIFHSARWDHSVSIKGKRIGIIGTGSTAVQIVSGVVDEVAELKLFQRTPQWVLPAFDKHYSNTAHTLVEKVPGLAKLFHRGYSAFYNSVLGAGFGKSRRVFLAAFEYLAQQHLNSVADPVLKKKLTPTYQFGCKRFILSDRFYEAIQKPQASVITESIVQVEENGIRTADGVLHELDVIVLATGFKAQNYLRPMQLTGQGGTTLEATWADGIKAYCSVAIPNFPNFFMLQGPHSPIGNFSLIKIAELQVGYLLPLIKKIYSGSIRAVAPRADVTERYNQDLRARGRDTIWLDKSCSSWYIDPNGNLTIWPSSIDEFQKLMAYPKLSDFEVIA